MFNRIVTHAGLFHADDAIAIAIAKQLDPSVPVVRVFKVDEKDAVDSGVLILDVGGKADRVRWFDHHQKDSPVAQDGHRYAAAGLLWNAFGERVCGGDSTVSLRVRQTLIDPVDRADNGVESVKPVLSNWRFVGLSQAISWLNPDDGATPVERDAAFAKAVEIAAAVLDGAVRSAKAWVGAMRTVQDALATAPQNARVLELAKAGAWQEHLLDDERATSALYVIYPSERGGFCLQCVPDKPGSFGMRKPLPAAWAGLRGETLAAVTGLPLGGHSSVFCHPGRFIGGCETLEMARRMAEMAVRSV